MGRKAAKLCETMEKKISDLLLDAYGKASALKLLNTASGNLRAELMLAKETGKELERILIELYKLVK